LRLGHFAKNPKGFKEAVMVRRLFGALLLVMLSAAVGLGQEQGGYLDTFIAKVRPEKRAEFDAVARKMAEANRRNHGDAWVTLESVYGEQNVVTFISVRSGYADVQKGFASFMGALGKSYGPAGADKIYQDFNNTLASAQNQIRRRRWDLSYNPPADAAAGMKTIGNARFVRTTIIRVRPGHGPEFEALLKDINAASQKSNQPGMRWVSMVTDGGSPFTYYLSRLVGSLGELDNAPPVRQLLGDEGFEKFQKGTAESVESVDYTISRFVPELSYPPAETVAAAPDFWTPKPAPAAKPKAAAPGESAPK
jgi:hypothetical protein